MAVLKFISDIIDAADSQKDTLLGLLDMSAAFDTVDHKILRERLEVSFALASTPPGMPGTHPLQYFGWGDVNGNIPTNIITYVRI